MVAGISSVKLERGAKIELIKLQSIKRYDSNVARYFFNKLFL